ncbi:MAG TPA: RDD family protein [Rhizomicrobium sp.]|nr:RDD family protein [Rhizomicrobium sp.]
MSTNVKPAPAGGETMPEPAQIAGFWRRIFALLIDMALLACVGIVIGVLAFRQVAAFGQGGRLIGAVITLLYYGLLNSRLGGGATPGKRLLGLCVVDREGNPVSPMRSLLRTAVFWTPYYLNGVFFPGLAPTQPLGIVVGFFDAVIVFGGIGLIIYLYLFNRRTRQSLHDLIAATFVVTRESVHRPVERRFWRAHLAIAGGCGLLILLLSVTALKFLWSSQTRTLNQLTALVQVVNSRPGVEYTQARISTFYSSSMTRTALVINVRLRGVPRSLEATRDEIADAVLRASPSILGEQNLGVTVSYGYDLGIFRWTNSNNYMATPKTWAQRLGAHGVGPTI